MKRFFPIFRVLGLLLMIFSVSMLTPLIIYFIYHDGMVRPFVISFFLTLGTGLLLWLPTHRQQRELKVRDGFLVVFLFWVVLSFFGALPFYLNFYPHLNFTDALFESVSGLTTTGGTVLTHLDLMPHDILYYRQQLTLLGGVGIIVLALAILPLLNIGGMHLYLAETAGPIKTSKIRPRLNQTAKSLWYIYMSLVAVCALAFWLAGMPIFESIGESFSAVSTGGFAVHDENFAYYHSHLIEVIGVFFMFLGAINFGLHYQFFKKRSFLIYIRDPEFMFYLKILATAILISFIVLLLYGTYHHKIAETFTQSLFMVTSVASTTGFTTTDLNQWPTFLPYFLMFLALIGGCGGSTSGGIKVLRFLLLQQQTNREMKRLIHPDGIFPVHLGEQPLGDKTIQSIWAFVTVFALLFIVLLLALLGCGLDPRTAFGALVGSIANNGIGLGRTSINFESINNLSKWILTFAMLAGRLEIFTVLVLFTPGYWRR